MPAPHPDNAPLPAATAPAAPTAATARFALLALATLPAVAGIALGLVGPAPVAIAGAVAAQLAAAGLAAAMLRRDYPHPALGLGNAVTLVRLALTSALVAPLFADALGWAVIAVALATLALDGVDGWLARREGRVSAFGARFDMEVDAALGLILALNAWAAGTVGAVVLLLGLPRYLFLVAARLLPWLDDPLPESFRRKAVCVLQIAALVALQVPALPASAAIAILAIATLALYGSFARDVHWLWRRTRV